MLPSTSTAPQGDGRIGESPLQASGTPRTICNCLAATIPENRRDFAPHHISCPANPESGGGGGRRAGYSATEGSADATRYLGGGGLRADRPLQDNSGVAALAEPEHAHSQYSGPQRRGRPAVSVSGDARNEEGDRNSDSHSGRARTCQYFAAGRVCARQHSPSNETATLPLPPSPPPSSERALYSDLNPHAAVFDPSRRSQGERPPSYSVFTLQQLEEYISTRQVVRIRFCLFNVNPSESTKALAASAAIFKVAFLDAYMDKEPKVLKSCFRGKVEKTQLLYICVACPLDYGPLLKQERFRHCDSYDALANLCDSVETSWRKFHRRKMLHLSEGEDGLCYPTLLRHSSPHLLYTELPFGNPTPSIVYFDTAKLDIKYMATAEDLYFHHIDFVQ